MAALSSKSSPSPRWEGRHYVAIDENGMGPRLGPLVVTSVTARIDPAKGGDKLATSKPKGALAKRIGDSKKLVAFEDSALGEAWARAIVDRGQAREDATPVAAMPNSGIRPRSDVRPSTPAQLLSAIGLETDEALQAPCPSHHASMCWGTEGEAFGSDDGMLASCAKDLDKLAAKGIEILRVRTAIVCNKRLNEAVDAGLSRFDVDLHTMERLTLIAREEAGEDVLALCGKVGGFDFYANRFGPLAGRLHTALVEGRAQSDYQIPGVGRLSFLRDADESHLLVGLASLVGKWVRDHAMRRVVRFHRGHLLNGAGDGADLPDASGYHDPTTTRFIAATKLLRKRLKVTPSCFERNALGRPSISSKPPALRKSS